MTRPLLAGPLPTEAAAAIASRAAIAVRTPRPVAIEGPALTRAEAALPLRAGRSCPCLRLGGKLRGMGVWVAGARDLSEHTIARTRSNGVDVQPSITHEAADLRHLVREGKGEHSA